LTTAYVPAAPRVLLPAPSSVIEPSSGLPRYGSYQGSVPSVDLTPLEKQLARARGSRFGVRRRLRRVVREKRWIYTGIASNDHYVALAIARFGYAATCFGYVFDAKSLRMATTFSVLGPPTACHVSDGMMRGSLASFRFGGSEAEVLRRPGSSAYTVRANIEGVRIDASLDTLGAPPAMTAIVPVGASRDGLVNLTEKRALLGVTGELELRGARHRLDGALGGYDYTHGMLARHTMWRWAYALGRATTGERVSFNLVQGFVGEPECTAWVEGDVFPLREGRFAFDRDEPLAEWRVSTADGSADLRFKPGGMHSEAKNLGLIQSHFVQPVGTYAGKLRVGGKELTLDGVLGVTEDQDVLW
jgi:hypothetical protein